MTGACCETGGMCACQIQAMHPQLATVKAFLTLLGAC